MRGGLPASGQSRLVIMGDSGVTLQNYCGDVLFETTGKVTGSHSLLSDAGQLHAEDAKDALNRYQPLQCHGRVKLGCC